MSESTKTHVLVVDDTPADRDLLLAYLQDDDIETDVAMDGEEAWEKLEGDVERYDLVLLDRMMPRLTGLELLARIKNHPRLCLLPVIIQTGAGEPEEVIEGITAGAYYYLIKPYDAKMLLSVVKTAAHDYRAYRELQSALRRGLQSLALLKEGLFRVRTLEEARDLGTVLANACPDPMNAVVGLTELLVNALEHGNLGITYDEKSRLNADGTWEDEVHRRSQLPENSRKSVELHYSRSEEELRFRILDQGPGFDWKRFVEIDPRRFFDNHGRGIVIARSISFDTVEYRGSGNEVVATVRLDSV